MLHVHCSLLDRADVHVFQTRFVIGWKNNKDGDIISMPLSLKTIGNAGYRNQ